MTTNEIANIVERDCGSSRALEAFRQAEQPTRKAEHYLYTNVAEALHFKAVQKGSYIVCGEAENIATLATTTDSQSPAQWLLLLGEAAASGCQNVALSGTDAEPIDLFAYNDSEHDALLSVRANIDVLPKAEKKLIIRHCCQGRGGVLAQTKINVAPEAKLSIAMLSDAPEAAVFSSTEINIGRGAQVQITTIDINAKTVRNDLIVNLNEEGACAELNGLYMVEKGCHADNNTLVAHNAPHCQSSELYKGVVDSGAVGAFCGKILVKPNSQNTAAQQTNRNMLLAPEARAYSQPQLEIYADDVKCSHGATSGQIDEAQLFYMQQRGIDKETAKQLLTAAFALEVVDKITIDSVRNAVSQRLTNEEEL